MWISPAPPRSEFRAAAARLRDCGFGFHPVNRTGADVPAIADLDRIAAMQ
jgi:hypothetical protein